MGTIIRTASMGLAGLILAGSCGYLQSGSAQHHEHVPALSAWQDEAVLLQEARRQIKNYAAAAGACRCRDRVGPAAWAHRQQGNGLPDAVMPACDAP
ncbi:MAG: hypothetical protein ACLRVT_05585 [Oscillospiraceae bacterium]